MKIANRYKNFKNRFGRPHLYFISFTLRFKNKETRQGDCTLYMNEYIRQDVVDYIKNKSSYGEEIETFNIKSVSIIEKGNY